MRSYLYVPGDNQRFLDKAETSIADAIILDLEDSVKSDSKKLAEDRIREFLQKTSHQNLLLRVEPTRLNQIEDLINHPKIKKIYLPKANTSKEIEALNFYNSSNKPIHALIESARGLENISEIATSNNVSTLGIGEADFFSDVSLSTQISQGLLNYVRSKLVIASAAHNMKPPVAPVSANFQDLDKFEAETIEFLNYGYWGRACIHPNQIEIANKIFSINPEMVAKAQSIIDSLRESKSGAVVDEAGSMIDAAHIKWAEKYLNLNHS